MKRLWNSIKNDTVLIIAFVLAIISSFFVKPSWDYLNYIDFTTLALLFCLMLIVNGLQSIKLFEQVAIYFLKKMKTTRQLDILLVGLCFFFSMFITNDVALITFVPLAIIVLKMLKMENRIVHVVVLQTIAANLGSMCTPIGNPQNLFLYTYFKMSLGDFLIAIIPFVLISFGLIAIHIVKKQDEKIKTPTLHQKDDTNIVYLWIYLIMFGLCLLSVLHLISIFYLLPIICLGCFYLDKKTLIRVDYNLLLTFVGFFIFIGNLKNIDIISQFLSQLVANNEIAVGVICSQIFSNVPATILLSGFTKNVHDLLIGVNIGGLGTLIASMASLISYKYIARMYPEHKKEYFKMFTKYNIIYLIILCVAAFLIKMVLYKFISRIFQRNRRAYSFFICTGYSDSPGI